MNTSTAIFAPKTAIEDLLYRTLPALPCDLARLIYLASTREYNNGKYHHEGLSARFGLEQAQEALRSAHQDIFSDMSCLTLEKLVEELDLYLLKSHEAADEFISTWQELEPYRVAIPRDADPVLVQLFLSNIRVALEILSFRREIIQRGSLASSQPQLPGR